MNQIFDLSRWWKLVTLHWVQNRKRYLLAIPAIAGLLLAWYIFLFVIDRYSPIDPFSQYTSYYCGLYFAGCLYASMVFSELGNQPQGIGYLSLPASHFEKLLCALLFSVVLFFTVFTIVFYLIDIPMVQFSNRLIEQEHRVYQDTGIPIGPVTVYNVFTGEGGPPTDRIYHALLLAYFAIQSAFILGSVYFTRYSFIKTTVAVLFIVFGYLLFEMKILNSTLPAGWNIELFMGWRQDYGRGNVYYVNLPSWAATIVGFVFRFCLPFIFWLITYFRLKEKEV